MAQFVDVINDPDLTIKLINNSQLIINFKDKKMRKQNKRVAKKKMQRNNFCAFIQAPAASSTAVLLFYPTFVSCSKSPAYLASCSGSLTYLLSCLILAPVPKSPAIFLSFSILDPAFFHLTFTALRIFKQSLSNELLCRHSISSVDYFCPFLLSSLLLDKIDF